MSNLLFKKQFFDSNGDPLSGGKVHFYTPDTTTPKNTYSDKALTVANTNPVILDSRGEADIWGSGLYDIKITDSLDVTIDTVDDVGLDASLIYYKRTDTGATETTISNKMSERLSAADFGATGDGTTDDTTAIQSAINAAETLGDGTRIFFPNGTYVISSTLTITKGIYLDFEYFGDSGSGATPNTGVSRIQWKAGSGANIMIRVKHGTLGSRVFYGGIDGVMLDGNDEAGTGLKLSSCQGFRIGLMYTYRIVTYGVLLNNDNQALLSNINIQTLRHFCGSVAASQGCNGLYIDGDQHSSGATSVYADEFEAEYITGNGLYIRGIDTCYFGRVRGIPRNGHVLHGGTDTGYAVRFADSTTALHAQKNYIDHLGRGVVYVEDNTVGNRIGFINSEGGAVVFQNGATPGSLIYDTVDRVHGDYFETHKWAMQSRIDVPISAMTISAGTPVMTTAGSFPIPYWAMDAAATETLVYTMAPQDKWNNGDIVGFRIGLVSVGTTTGNVLMNIKLSTVADAGGPGAGELTQNYAFTPQGTTTLLSVHQETFATALAYTRDDSIVVSISRVGGDALDTYTNDIGFAWLQLLYESDGPDSAGAGPWGIPVRNMD